MHSHSLPQRQQGRGQQEAGGRRGRGLGTRGPGARPRRGGGGRRRVGVLVTAQVGHGMVPLVRLGTAEVTEAHVLTSLVTEAGERLELLEIFISTTPHSVTASSGWT